MASSTATVTESALLPDITTGSMREVDILIEDTVNGFPVRIAIECQDRGRRATVAWVEQLHTKYMHLDVNQVVAVSRAGFSETASKKAKSLKIVTLSTKDESEFDWRGLLTKPDQSGFVSQSFRLIIVLRTTLLSGKDEAISEDAQIYDVDGTYVDTMGSYNAKIHQNEILQEMTSKKLRELDSSSDSKQLVYIAQKDVSWHVIDTNNNKFYADLIAVFAEVRL